MKKYVKHGDRNQNKIALTFDDGPNPYFTPKILDILDIYNIKATFFILGQYAEMYPEIVIDIEKRGHLIGNHSYSHTDDFLKGKKILESILNKEIIYFRLPGIDFSLLPDDYDSKTNIAFDVDSWDFKNISEDNIYKNVVENINNGSIVDFHDGSEVQEEWESRPQNMVTVLPKIIENLKSKYELVTIDKMSLLLTDKKFETNETI